MKMPNDVIREEIQKAGVLPFVRFMDLALYCPETGYYEKKQDIVGRRGDFITSVSVGCLFGELLAFRFAQWLEELRTANVSLRIVEAGAHDGRLAADILVWLEKFRPELFSVLEYWILEPSPTRRAWQKKYLAEFLARVRWADGFGDFKRETQASQLHGVLHGVLFGNELLDAFPVRRFGWDAKGKKWYEWGVALAGESFCWRGIDIPAEDLPLSLRHLSASLLEVLPAGYTVESSPAAENWWREAAGIFFRGKFLALDYGFTDEEQFSPSRVGGTLRAYHRHRVSDDLLAQPGEQDLTAHVNFSAIQKAGEAAGLKTEMCCPQPQFLTGILAGAVKEKTFACLDTKRVRQFQTLTHPEHLGRAFRVLVQGR
jgi:SAM-dependent MidA family methyltransferase